MGDFTGWSNKDLQELIDTQKRSHVSFGEWLIAGDTFEVSKSDTTGIYYNREGGTRLTMEQLYEAYNNEKV